MELQLPLLFKFNKTYYLVTFTSTGEANNCNRTSVSGSNLIRKTTHFYLCDYIIRETKHWFAPLSLHTNHPTRKYGLSFYNIVIM